jgi:hypothetical protein
VKTVHPNPVECGHVCHRLKFLCVAGAVGLLLILPRLHAQTQVADGVVRVGDIEHFAIEEGSGLAASRRYPGVLWTHNDGGYQFLFALTETGGYLGAFQVVGANLIDWEAIASDDQGNLYLADIGSNGIARTHVAVHRVREPNPSDRYGNADVTRTWYLRFPGLREDCESFFVLDGYGYLITKPRALDDRVTMYRYPLSRGSGSTLLEEVTRFSVTAPVTDASVSTDGQRLGVLTSQGAYLYHINGNPAAVNSATREFTSFINDFMEGAAFMEQGLMVSAETRELWLFTNGAFPCNTPASFTTPLADQTVLAGGVVQLDPGAVGCPVPVFSWRFDGQLLAGQTNSALVLSNVTVLNAGLYEVTASNRFGSVVSSANLTIRSSVDVHITEVMSGAAVSPGVPTADWWELTSFSSDPVDLTGWRFNDSGGGLLDPYVFISGPIIAPGESVVFIEDLTPQEFRSWWGDTNLPPGLQIVSYTGSGLSFLVTGDTLLLWDNTSTVPGDTIARAAFGASELGVSFNYDPVSQQFGARSELGVNGVHRAAVAPDIGSPGRIFAPPSNPMPGTNGPVVSPFAEGVLLGDRIQIAFDALVGRRYLLESCDDLAGGNWAPTGDVIRTTNNSRAVFERERTANHRFYRVRVD